MNFTYITCTRSNKTQLDHTAHHQGIFIKYSLLSLFLPRFSNELEGSTFNDLNPVNQPFGNTLEKQLQIECCLVFDHSYLFGFTLEPPKNVFIQIQMKEKVNAKPRLEKKVTGWGTEQGGISSVRRKSPTFWPIFSFSASFPNCPKGKGLKAFLCLILGHKDTIHASSKSSRARS